MSYCLYNIKAKSFQLLSIDVVSRRDSLTVTYDIHVYLCSVNRVEIKHLLFQSDPTGGTPGKPAAVAHAMKVSLLLFKSTLAYITDIDKQKLRSKIKYKIYYSYMYRPNICLHRIVSRLNFDSSAHCFADNLHVRYVFGS